MSLATPITTSREKSLDQTRVQAIRTLPALQQPAWSDHAELDSARTSIAGSTGIVTLDEVLELRSILSRASDGDAIVLQIGDCAESFDDSTLDRVAAKTSLLRMLAEVMSTNTGKEVVTIGRIAGQYAKPRSAATEKHNGYDLPVYRGPLVNSPEPNGEARVADARRLRHAYLAASKTYQNIQLLASSAYSSRTWASHEALVLDYELPLVRVAEDGTTYLSSTHLPWIGDRTRQRDHGHVALASAIVNPVGCKVGPSMTEAELLTLCAALNPTRTPGRLTLISRLGVGGVETKLPGLARAVRNAGFPAVWLCDPMHANTYKTAEGLKTRNLKAIIREVNAFQDALAIAGVASSGLHLETTPDHVSECVSHPDDESSLGRAYTSLCDPRLNPSQAFTVVNEWR